MYDKHYQLFRVFNNVIKLVQLRGYTIEPMEYETFKKKYVMYDTIVRSTLNRVVQQHLSIIFHDNPTFTMVHVKEMQAYFTQHDIRHCILVTINTPSSNILRELHRISGVQIEVFTDKELLYNPLEHHNVPEYRVLAQDEIEHIKKSFNMKTDNFPLMTKTDIISKWLNLKRGTVLEITSNSETSGKYVSYRMIQ